MKKKMVLSFVGIFLLLLAVLPFLTTDDDTVVNGVFLSGEDIGGMSREEVHHLLKEKEAHIHGEVFYLVHDEYEYPLPLSEFDTGINVEDTEEKIFSVGRKGNILQQWWDRIRGWWRTNPIEYTVLLDESKLREYIEKKAKEFSGEMKNARLVWSNDGTLTILPEVPYIVFNIPETEKRIREAIRLQNVKKIPLNPTEVVKPTLTEEMLAPVDSVVSQYTTYFGGDYNRSSNIRVAAETINGFFMAPNEVFSYNSVTGERTSAAGYLAAPVYINGKLEPGTGGGICQVSTAMFNAALLAGLEITERSPHFAPVGYIEIGRDATVAYGYIDFGFRNSFSHPVYIMSDYEPGRLTITILGNHVDVPLSAYVHNGEVVTLVHDTKEKVDQNQKEDKLVEEGHDGYETTIYRHVAWSDGREVNDSFYSYYEPVDTITTFSSEEKERLEKEKNVEEEKKQAESEKETVINEEDVEKITLINAERAEETDIVVPQDVKKEKGNEVEEKIVNEEV